MEPCVFFWGPTWNRPSKNHWLQTGTVVLGKPSGRVALVLWNKNGAALCVCVSSAVLAWNTHSICLACILLPWSLPAFALRVHAGVAGEHPVRRTASWQWPTCTVLSERSQLPNKNKHTVDTTFLLGTTVLILAQGY